MKEEIKNIIFDLGGVLLNIDYNRTKKYFEKLGIKDFDRVFTQYKQSNIADLFETGKATDEAFFKEVTKGHTISWDDFELAWNAMLLDFPKDRFELLKKLKTKYRLFLCSNTNSIHLKSFRNEVNKFEERFDDLFEKTYYSHLVGLRKPNTEIFQLILDENNLKPSETLFLDDTTIHLEGANKVGIKTIHVSDVSVKEIFADWLN